MLNALSKHAAMPADFMNSLMQLSSDSTKHIMLQQKKIYTNVMPDVTGMGLKDAVYMLESNGMQVQVQGKGKVRGQSIPAGTKIEKGQNIILQLS